MSQASPPIKSRAQRGFAAIPEALKAANLPIKPCAVFWLRFSRPCFRDWLKWSAWYSSFNAKRSSPWVFKILFNKYLIGSILARQGSLRTLPPVVIFDFLGDDAPTVISIFSAPKGSFLLILLRRFFIFEKASLCPKIWQLDYGLEQVLPQERLIAAPDCVAVFSEPACQWKNSLYFAMQRIRSRA